MEKMHRIFHSLGHETARLRMTSEGARESLAGKFHAAWAGIHSPAGIRAMRDAIKRERPDIINVHNLYPFISPAALFEAKKAGIPVVMTVHNFRLVCPTGLFMRDGAPCELCLERGNEAGCIRYNCEHSRLKSVAYALRNAHARRTGAYRKCVDRFACITDFQRIKLTKAGFDPQKLALIPNAIDLPDEPPTAGEGKYVAFCGRLSAEKGIDLIMEVARRHPEIPFKIAGETRDKSVLSEVPENVTLTGYVQGKELEDLYRDARFMVMASKWYEGFPMAILESARHSKATVGPDHGGFTEIIGRGKTAAGALFKPGSADALEREVVRLWQSPKIAMQLGESAYHRLRTRYSTPVISRQWALLLTELAVSSEL